MTPREKAMELTNKFARVEPYLPSKDKVLFMYEAKQCSLIAIDEILEQDFESYTDKNGELVNPKLFWVEVRKEVERF